MTANLRVNQIWFDETQVRCHVGIRDSTPTRAQTPVGQCRGQEHDRKTAVQQTHRRKMAGRRSHATYVVVEYQRDTGTAGLADHACVGVTISASVLPILDCGLATGSDDGRFYHDIGEGGVDERLRPVLHGSFHR